MHLRQLYRLEYRPARGAVDLRRLVIGVGDRLQAGVAQQRDEAGPVPDVHHDDGGPGVELVGDVIVVEAQAVQGIAEQADVGPAKYLPDGADHVPRDQQRQREDHQARRDRPTMAWHRQRHHDAERHLDRENDGREQQIAAERGQEASAEIGRGIEQFLEPADAVPEELVVAEGVLHRIVHDRHQRQDRGERDHQKHRQHQEPGFLVDGLVHQAIPSTRRLSA